MKHALLFAIAFSVSHALMAQVPFESVSTGDVKSFGEDFQVARDVRFMDANNDGFPELAISHGNQNQYYPDIRSNIIQNNNGKIGPEFLGFSNRNNDPYDSFIFADADGDGDTDVLHSGRWDIYDNYGITSQNIGPDWEDAQLVDLDLDGDLDIVAIEEDRVVQYFNLGGGDYSSAILIKEIEDGIQIASADMNLDGYPDLVASWSTNIWWWGNNGSGGFGGGNNIENALEEELLLADIDGDGDPDIVHGSTYRANNIGSYSSHIPLSGVSLAKLRFKDVDQDGDLDLFGYKSGTIGWLENLDSGGFGPGTSLLETGTTGADLGDIDGDGIFEMATAHSGYVYIWRQTGSWDFVRDPARLVGSDSAAGGMASADLNEDGLDDLISIGNEIRWRSPGHINSLVHVGGGFGSLGTSDVNDDGHIDVLFADSDGQVGWVPNDGQANFSPAIEIGLFAGIHNMVVRDMDADGDLDLACSTPGGLYWFEDTGVDFTVMHTVYEGVLSDDKLELGDANGDNVPDFFLRGAEQHDLLVVWSDGAGGFAAPEVLLNIEEQIQDLAVTDFDVDGKSDVVFVTYNEVYGSVPSGYLGYLQNSDLGFSAVDTLQMLPAGASSDYGYSANIYAKDMSLDGAPDLMVFFYQAGRIDYVHNDGAGNVANYNTQTWSTSQFNSWDEGAMGDYNGDGAQDIFLRLGSWPYWIENEIGQGCIDPTACNFDEAAFISDGSCCFGICGCTNDDALDYNPAAECNDGSCTFRITGSVFFDEDEDGEWDMETELPIPFQQVLVEPTGTITYTDDAGNFSVTVPDNGAMLSTIDHPAFPFTTTLNPRTINTSYLPSTVLFGLSTEAPLYQVCVDFYPGGSGLCDAPRNYNICYRNMGNVTIDGIIEVEHDVLFQGYVEVTPIDSVVENRIYMSFENLNPGEMFFYDVGLIIPTTDFIGETLNSTTRIYGMNDGFQVAYGEQHRTETVTCAYDPNDKQVFPIGHTEEHLIAEETTQEFVVRFQNTGNAPAQNITIRDTLDANFDLNTFHFVANSHSVQTTLNPETRELVFFFPEIFLPDSTCCEPESHGLISYKIKPKAELDAGTVLHNTAYIFFDNNPPIVTNTTWSTIHTCKEALVLSASSVADCLGDMVTVNSDYNHTIDWDQQFDWTDDLETLEGDHALYLTVDAPLNTTVSFVATNPICVETGSLALDYTPINLDPSCPGDFNCDGEIGTTDIIMFVGAYGCVGPGCRLDLTDDNISDADDILILLGLYGSLCP